MGQENGGGERTSLQRFLAPRRVAIVGASENLMYSANTIRAMDGGDIELRLVNPRRPEVFGHKTFPSLSAIEEPIDAAIAFVKPELSVQAVEEAAAMNVGGIAVTAGGFAEVGGEGAELQERMRRAAVEAGMAAVGPNTAGLMNIQTGMHMYNGPRIPLRPGGLSVISHSGGFIGGTMDAGLARRIGFNLLIGPGNEAVTDMAAFLDYLVDDPDTKVIALIFETLRRPDAFFAAAERARQANKPIVALRLARSSRAQSIARSHTGAIVGDVWAQEVAFRQVGIELVKDTDELLDRAALLEQLPRERWAKRGTAVMVGSGGMAALSTDVAAEEELKLPELTELSGWVSETVPGISIPNPIDLTGFVVSEPDIMPRVINKYGTQDELDAIVLICPLGEGEEDWSAPWSGPFAEAAGSITDKALILTTTAATEIGDWTSELQDKGLALGRGITATLRGVKTMNNVEENAKRSPSGFLSPLPPVEMPPGMKPIDTDAGRILPFAATMRLLEESGVPVAPWTLLEPGADAVEPPTEEGPYVVKLADVPHRTEHGAVDLGVSRQELDESVKRMRAIAEREGLPATVAVQPMLDAEGELFLGVQNHAGLQPIVVVGHGGILIEVISKAVGRLAPLNGDEPAEMLDELGDYPFKVVRGGAPWDRTGVEEALSGLSRFASGAASWLESVDVNPLIWTGEKYCAVDGLIVVAEEANG